LQSYITKCIESLKIIASYPKIFAKSGPTFNELAIFNIKIYWITLSKLSKDYLGVLIIFKAYYYFLNLKWDMLPNCPFEIILGM
jgi:hypothetical protein